MKFLFFTGELSENLNATNKIASELAGTISSWGHSVVLMGANYDGAFHKQTSSDFEMISITPSDAVSRSRKKLNSYLGSHSGDRSALIKKFTLSHPFSALCVNYSYSPAYKGMENACRAEIEKLYSTHNFDYVVCFQEPSWAERVMMMCDIPDEKKVIYQTDPYGMHLLASEEARASHRKDELSNFQRVKHIFTTTLLEKEYYLDGEYSVFCNKVTGVEFPNVKKPARYQELPAVFDSKDTNIVFCGLMDDSYRSPEKFFAPVCPHLTPDIKFHFWGNITSRSAYEYQKKYPENIFINPPVDSVTAAKIQLQADFLLNIGNSVSNQVPSKIFDYFSLGKPIINIQKIENCPAREYLDRYPLCFTFSDFAPDTDGLVSFLEASKGKRISFDEIREIYREATPEYVADKIIRILSTEKES